jgi:hypothetical protein
VIKGTTLELKRVTLEIIAGVMDAETSTYRVSRIELKQGAARIQKAGETTRGLHLLTAK